MKIALVWINVLAKSSPECPEPEFYRDYAWEFWHTYDMYRPDIAHEVHVIFAGRPPVATDYIAGAAYVPAYYSHVYEGHGKDIGAYQHVAKELDEAGVDFAIWCATVVRFWKRGWMERLVEAWQCCGDGLYGPMASYENSPHIRSSCFACSPKLLRSYPMLVDNYQKPVAFESCKGSFTDWVLEQKKAALMVTWDGLWEPSGWRTPPNIFRRGDQSNCMTLDRYTDEYENADPDVKAKLEAKADGK